jgi:hypothetical protein
VTPNELLSEIRQYLAEDIHSCIYTSYHFEHAGKVIKEDQPELQNAIPEIKDGAVLTIVEGTSHHIIVSLVQLFFACDPPLGSH